MTSLVKVHKKYIVRKPIEEVTNYLTSLELSRKHLEADINGGIVSKEPPVFAFTIPAMGFSQIPTRTLIHATLLPNADMTNVKVVLTPNVAFVLLALIGVIYAIAAWFTADSTERLLKGIGIGAFIFAVGCIADALSKKVVLGTFERCLRDIHKQRTIPAPQNGN